MNSIPSYFCRIGKNISTKSVGKNRDRSTQADDREDITDQYKYKEGTAAERAAVWSAACVSTKPYVYRDDNADEVRNAASVRQT
mgnify:CR=1 FL=1